MRTLPAKGPIFKIGDAVTFTNEFGVQWKNKTITGMEIWPRSYHSNYGREEPYWRYYYEPSDAPWFPSAEIRFMLE